MPQTKLHFDNFGGMKFSRKVSPVTTPKDAAGKYKVVGAVLGSQNQTRHFSDEIKAMKSPLDEMRFERKVAQTAVHLSQTRKMSSSKPFVLFFNPVRHAASFYEKLQEVAHTEVVTSESREEFFKDVTDKYKNIFAIYRTSASGAVCTYPATYTLLKRYCPALT